MLVWLSKNMNKRILLIDDDETTTGLLGRLLNRYGFEVLATNSGPEGIRLAWEYDPAMVILDLMMPEMAGWQVCKEIRLFSNVHILIFSAVSELNLVAKALYAGADHFLSKPTPITVLVTYINETVNLASGQMFTLPGLLPLQNS